MAKVTAVWGIDIGQCGLKAIRCRIDDENSTKIVADAFDYIEYPKILTEPEAEPEGLVHDALELFLSRNTVIGDRVAVSASGQNGLARFIKLPPVETKKIPDIVHYEAKQQIPFELEDVIWDYQKMHGGSEEDGYSLETEVGLFAMKRDQVEDAVRPLRQAGIEIEVVQLTPLAIYNAVVYDRLGELPPDDEYDPDDPPPSLVAISLGTETTDLVITNGFRVWQRNIPIGGSHFTRALTKELNLTYAKAEHLKRNATNAEDPKAIYQAMRPVFKDFLTEVQRSIGFFQSLDRAASIGRIVAMGNSMKLPGLKRYLSQNLGYEIEEIESFATLEGGAVVDTPTFKDNVLCFGVAYGLAIQGLGRGHLSTNLVPRELIRERIIREKKPWAVAAVTLLMTAILVNFLILWWPYSKIRINDDDDWTKVRTSLNASMEEAKNCDDAYGKKRKEYNKEVEAGQQMMAHVSRRRQFVVMLKSLNECFPTSPTENRPEAFEQRNEIHLADLKIERFDKLEKWATSKIRAAHLATLNIDAPVPSTKELLTSQPKPAPEIKVQRNRIPRRKGRSRSPKKKDKPAAKLEAPKGSPRGPGYVVEITGYHFHNLADKPAESGARFVKQTLIKNISSKEITLPSQNGEEERTIKLKDLGISYPVLLEELKQETILVPNPKLRDVSERGASEEKIPKKLELTKYSFVLQFAWTPKFPKDRPSKKNPSRRNSNTTARK